jgi:hypothetical protein
VRTGIVPQANDVRPVTAADLGLIGRAIHEARQLRDAEAADPGVIRRTRDARLAEAQEPTKAAVRMADCRFAWAAPFLQAAGRTGAEP